MWGSRVEISIHSFLTSALNGGEWSASRHSNITPGMKGLCALNMRRPRTRVDVIEDGKSLEVIGVQTSYCPGRSIVSIWHVLSRFPKY
jgi:hypothetical protein